jgi:hypothetical protein
MPLLDSLATRALDFHASAQPVDGSTNRFAVKLLGSRAPLDVTEIGRRIDVQNHLIDLEVVAKNVRFAGTAIDDLTVLGGMPIAEATSALTSLTPLTQGPLSPPGVPGLLGRLRGTIPIPVEVIDQLSGGVPNVDARLRITDERGQAVSTASWTVGSRTISGSAVSIPRDLLTDAALSGTTSIARVQLPVQFVELTLDALPITRYQIQASVRLSIGETSTGWIDVPPDPIPLSIPALAIPTVAVFCTANNFSGRKLIMVPTSSPLTEPGELRNVIEALQGVLNDLSETLSFLGLFVSSIRDIHTALLPGGGQAAPAFVKADGIANLQTTVLVERGLWDFNAGDHFNSVLLIGPENRTLEMFNNPDYKDREGQLDLVLDRSLIALIRRLDSASPTSVPSGAARVRRRPTDPTTTDSDSVDSFANEISSVSFQ